MGLLKSVITWQDVYTSDVMFISGYAGKVFIIVVTSCMSISLSNPSLGGEAWIIGAWLSHDVWI